MTPRATSMEVRAVFERAKADPRTERDDPKVAAAIYRAGRVGDRRQLALACQMSRERLDRSVSRLRALGYLPGGRDAA